MKCSIIRDRKGDILGVNAPNGKPSNLFSVAYQYLTGEQYVEYGKRVNPVFGTNNEVAQHLIDRLKDNGLADNVYQLTDNEINTKVSELTGKDISVIEGEGGKITGFIHGKDVYLNKEFAKPDTPIHEFSHLFYNRLKETRPVTYNKGLSLVRAEMNKSDSEFKSLFDEVRTSQPDLTEAQLVEEVLVELTGKKGLDILNKSKSKGGIIEWLKEFFNDVKTFLGLRKTSNIDVYNLTLERFTELAAVDLLSGVNIANSFYSESPSEFRYDSSVLNNKFVQQQLAKDGVVGLQQLVNHVMKPMSGVGQKVVQEVLDTQFKDRTKIPMSEFYGAVQAAIMPLRIRKTDLHASRGVYNFNINNNNFGHFNTYVLQTPFDINLKANHFEKIKGAAGHYRAWVETDKEMDYRPGNDVFIVEIQSDMFQKPENKASLSEVEDKQLKALNKHFRKRIFDEAINNAIIQGHHRVFIPDMRTGSFIQSHVGKEFPKLSGSKLGTYVEEEGGLFINRDNKSEKDVILTDYNTFKKEGVENLIGRDKIDLLKRWKTLYDSKDFENSKENDEILDLFGKPVVRQPKRSRSREETPTLTKEHWDRHYDGISKTIDTLMTLLDEGFVSFYKSTGSNFLASLFGGEYDSIVSYDNGDFLIFDLSKQKIKDHENIKYTANLTDEEHLSNLYEGFVTVAKGYKEIEEMFDKRFGDAVKVHQDADGWYWYYVDVTPEMRKNAKVIAFQKHVFDDSNNVAPKEHSASIVGLANSPEFKQFSEEMGLNKDVNGEPLLQDVLNFERLSRRVEVDYDLQLAMQRLNGVEGGREAFLNSFLDENGDFVLDGYKLGEAGFYNDVEIENLLTNTPVNLEDLVRSVADYEGDLVVSQTRSFPIEDSFDELGFQKTANVDDFIKDMFKDRDYFANEGEFEAYLRSQDASVVNGLMSVPAMYEYVKNKALNGRKVEIKAVDENGDVVDVLTRDVGEELKEVLVVDEDLTPLINDLSILINTSPDVLSSDTQALQFFADRLVDTLIDSNIDLKGLQERVKNSPIEDTLNFLDELGVFLTKVDNSSVSDTDIGAFADAYNDYFEVGNDYTVEVNDNMSGISVVNIENAADEVSMFNKGYLKIGDNLYTPLDVKEDYETLKEMMFDSYAIEGVDASDGKIPTSYSGDTYFKNVDDYVADMAKEYYPKDQDVRKLILLKTMLKSDFEKPADSKSLLEKNVKEYVQDKNVDISDLNGFENDFAASVYQRMLEERSKDSNLYHKVLKYLKIGKDIVFNNLDAINYLKSITTEDETLRTLKELFADKDVDVKESDIKEFVSSNPEVLDTVKDASFDNGMYMVKEGVVNKDDYLQFNNEAYALNNDVRWNEPYHRIYSRIGGRDSVLERHSFVETGSEVYIEGVNKVSEKVFEDRMNCK